MDTSRNKFSNAMCVLFTGVLLVLFCVCVGRKFGISNMVSRMIITGVYCGVVVGLAFVLNKAVKKFAEGDKHIDHDKAFLASMIITSVLFVAFRLLVISDIIKVEFSKGSVYDMAKIGETGRIYTGMTTIDSVFATMLSAMFKVFGNMYFPVYLTQTLLSVAAFALIVWSVKGIFGRFPSVTVAAGMAVLPIFYRNIANDGSDCLILLMFGIILWICALYKNSIENSEVKTFFSLFVGALTGVFAIYSTLFMFFIVIPIIILWNCNSETTKDRIVNTFCMIFGHVFAFGLTLILYSYLIEKSGVVGFVDLIMKHINYRFGFISNPAFILKIGDERGIFLLLILCVFYTVMFWRSEEDTAHIIIPFWVIVFAQMFFINVNNRPAYIMIFALCLLTIGGCGLLNVGIIDRPVRVVKIEDDMQPVQISSIDDKPVSVAEVRQAFNDNNLTLEEEKETKPEVVIRPQEEPKPEEVKQEEPKLEEPVQEEPKQEEPVQEEKSEPVTESEPENERKYNAPEVRQTSDFGMNDVDFESLFNGETLPPKAVAKDIYEEIEEVKEEESEEESETPEMTDEKSDLAVINEESPTDFEVNEDEEVNKDSSSDQKAYVDSFFGYLYEEPQKQYVSHASNFADLDLDLGVDAFDNINVEADKASDQAEAEVSEMISDKADESVSEDETVKEADFAQKPVLDLAEQPLKGPWENFSVEETRTEPKREIENIENEFVFDFDEPSADYRKGWEPIRSEDTSKTDELEVFKALEEADGALVKEQSTDSDFFVEESGQTEEEFSIEEMLGKKIDEDEGFSYEEALNNKIENEEIESNMGFSYEDALSKKLDVEEAIEKAKFKDDFSIEEALHEKIVTEESIDQADHLNDISVVKAVEQKMNVEDGIKENLADEEFSFQEAFEQKLDVEKSIEEAQNNEALAEFAGEELITEDDFDFSGNGLNSGFVFDDAPAISNGESEPETVETFSFDSEPVIEKALQEPVLEPAKEPVQEPVKEDAVKPEEIDFIENPLPLPKKHVHREMDYGRSIPEAWMHYDVELNSTNNKYDI